MKRVKRSVSFWVVIAIILVSSAIVSAFVTGVWLNTCYNNLHPRVITMTFEPANLDEVPRVTDITSECSTTFEVIAPTDLDLSDFEQIPMVAGINSETALVLGLILENARQAHQNKILLRITTPGGSMHDMWAIVDTILYYRRQGMTIYTLAEGYSCSAGFEIMLAGERRFIGQYTNILYHSGYLINEDGTVTPKDIKEAQDLQRSYYNPKKVAFIMAQTNNNEELRKIIMSSGDHWMTPRDAIRMGIVEGVL